MKFKDVVFPPILCALDALQTKIDAIENIDTDIEILELSFDLSTFIASIRECANGDRDEKCLGDVLEFLGTPSNLKHFEIIEPACFHNLKIFLKLGIIIENNEILDDEVNFPMDQFKIIVDTGSALPFNAFAVYNSTQQNDSLGYLCFSDDKWHSEIANSNFNNLLLICFIFALNTSITSTFNQRYILVRKDAQNEASIQSSLRLQAVVHGKQIHMPVVTTIVPSLCAIPFISPLNAYQQFDETIVILSEFNSRGEILNKFLSLYHVIESFMYKIPIIDLGKKNDGNMFSIRDFRRLYSKVEKSELDAIKDIFKMFWNTPIDNRLFSNIIEQNLNDLKHQSNFKKSDLDQLLAKLDLFPENGYTQLLSANGSSNYAKVIYKIRCAIVHNSETEMHISHFTLSETTAHLINEVLMKPLEMLIMKLIADKSSAVWYTGPSFKLYSA